MMRSFAPGSWLASVRDDLVRRLEQGDGGVICEIRGRNEILAEGGSGTALGVLSAADAFCYVLSNCKVKHWVIGPVDRCEESGESYEAYYLCCEGREARLRLFAAGEA